MSPGVDTVAVVLLQLAVVLAVARTLGAVAARLGFTAVVGELLTGFVLGPSLLGAVAPGLQRTVAPAPGGAVDALAVLGVLFLLALAGLELDLDLVRGRARTVGAVAGAGMALPFLLGAATGLVVPPALLVPGVDRHVFSLFLATALSLSAIPVVARILLDLDLYHRPFGQVVVAAAMVTDAVGWLLVGLVTGLARTGVLDWRGTLGVVAALAGFLLVSFTVGRRLLAAALDRVGRADRGRGHLSLLLVATLGAGAVTLEIGLEPAVGAFVAGAVFARTDGVSPAATDAFEALTLGFFAPLFFAVAGLRADLGLLADPTVLGLGAGLVVVASVGKFGGVYVAALATGASRREAAGMGVGLNARGALEIVVATIGLEFGILSPAVYTVILLVAIVTTAVAPPLLRRLFRPAAPGAAAAG